MIQNNEICNNGELLHSLTQFPFKRYPININRQMISEILNIYSYSYIIATI